MMPCVIEREARMMSMWIYDDDEDWKKEEG
jgi:hypothetical protein